MLDFKKIQKEQAEWVERNFGKQPGAYSLLGMGEELGELFHAYLKMIQGIRGTEEEMKSLMRDAIGDIVIFTMGFCNSMGFDFEFCVEEAWRHVVQRDWKNNLTHKVAGTFQGQTFYEGDRVKTSDGKLEKTIEWSNKDYGWGTLYQLARYAEKTGCKLIRIQNGGV